MDSSTPHYQQTTYPSSPQLTYDTTTDYNKTGGLSTTRHPTGHNSRKTASPLSLRPTIPTNIHTANIKQTGPNNNQQSITHGNAPLGSGSYLGPKTHIQHSHPHYRNTCTHSLQIIKTLTVTGWGKQKETLMATYKTVMRPALEYACCCCSPSETYGRKWGDSHLQIFTELPVPPQAAGVVVIYIYIYIHIYIYIYIILCTSLSFWTLSFLKGLPFFGYISISIFFSSTLCMRYVFNVNLTDSFDNRRSQCRLI